MNLEPNPLELEATPYLVRPMNLGDLEDVVAVERACFSMPWPASAFRYDLTQNQNARYLVAIHRQAGTASHRTEAQLSWWQRFWRGEGERHSQILAYAGLWCLVDEAHIANIAVLPACRGRGLGELMLVSMLDEAVLRGMTTATLEVRPSNAIAQSLYRKYGFEVVGRRTCYYSDNGEDALIMSTGALTSIRYQRTLALLKEALLARLSEAISTR